MLLLSYNRLLRRIWLYGYIVVPIIVFSALASTSKTLFSWYGFSFLSTVITQFVALLLRPSLHKKDNNYSVMVLKHNAAYLLLIPFFSLVIPFFLLPSFLVFVVFFQLIAADTRIRMISVWSMIRAALLLLWYNLLAVLVVITFLTGLFWGIRYLETLYILAYVLALCGFFVLLLSVIALLIVVYTASVYEYEQELF